MDLRAYIAGVALVGLMVAAAGVGAIALDKTVADEQRDFGPENDTLVVDYSTIAEVEVPEAPDRFYENETVRNASGVALDEGIDYEFHSHNGTVEWFNTSRTTTGGDATITVYYRGWNETTGQLNRTLPPLVNLLPYVALVIVGAVALVALGIAVVNGTIGTSSGTRRY